MKSATSLIVFAALILAACGDRQQGGAGGDAGGHHPHGSAHGDHHDDHHGDPVELGRLALGGEEFTLVQLGGLHPGHECAFELRTAAGALPSTAGRTFYLWVESGDGSQLSAPDRGVVEDGALHFHATVRTGAAARAVVRLRADDLDDRASLPVHAHPPEGPRHGILAEFRGEPDRGHLELKLHDDKGDLELWLAKDAAMTQPFDLPLSTRIEISFPDMDHRTVRLAPRDEVRNEDEDGNANIRDGRTNYFIFPGPGEDSSWLTGANFKSRAVVRFTAGERSYATDPFLLTAHKH